MAELVNIIKKKMPFRNLVKQIMAEITDFYPRSGQYDKKIISTSLKQDKYVKKNSSTLVEKALLYNPY